VLEFENVIISRAAEISGLTRPTVREKMKKYGVSR